MPFAWAFADLADRSEKGAIPPGVLQPAHFSAKIGATLHKREGPRRWRAFIRNARRLRDGDVIDFGADVSATAVDRESDGSYALEFAGDEPLELLLDRVGHMPLPPYIAGKRATDRRPWPEPDAMVVAAIARTAATATASASLLRFTGKG